MIEGEEKAELILLKKNTIKKVENDIFSYLGPSIDKIASKEKLDLISAFSGGIGFANLSQHIVDSKELVVEIPEDFKVKIANRTAKLASSGKIPNNFTPNIMQDGKIVGQVTLKEATDKSSVLNGLENIAVIAMLQNILCKLNDIDEKISKVLKNQKNDRVGKAIGAFTSFANLYPTLKSKDEFNIQVNNSYTSMQEALSQMFIHIKELRDELDECPRNYWGTIKSVVLHPTRNIPEEMQAKYCELVGDLQVYTRLFLLKDYLLYLKDKSINEFIESEDPYFKFCDNRLDEDFKMVMRFINNRPPTEISRISDECNKIKRMKESYQDATLKLEVSKDELLLKKM